MIKKTLHYLFYYGYQISKSIVNKNNEHEDIISTIMGVASTMTFVGIAICIYNLFGSGDYAMRIWLNPNKIAERGMTASEVTDAIREQNVQVAAGVIGGPPYEGSVQVQLPVNVQGRLQSAEEFEQVIIKRGKNGVVTRLKDVARVELDAQSYALRSMLNNQQAVAIPIFAAPGSNALEISKNISP